MQNVDKHKKLQCLIFMGHRAKYYYFSLYTFCDLHKLWKYTIKMYRLTWKREHCPLAVVYLLLQK